MDGLVSSYIITFNLLLSFAMPGMIVIFCLLKWAVCVAWIAISPSQVVLGNQIHLGI